MNNYSQYNCLLEVVSKQVWIKRVPFHFLGVPIGTRMTVIQLGNNQLFVHSPIFLTKETKKELDTLGIVKYIVLPNNMYNFVIDEYYDQYKQAQIYAAPGLLERRADLHFNYLLKDNPEKDWADYIDQMIFEGDPKLKEVVFYHKLSKTLILGDLIVYFDEESPIVTKIAAKALGIYNRPSSTLETNLSIAQKKQAQASVNRILEWDFERIILAHGRIIEIDGKRVFQDAFSWLF